MSATGHPEGRNRVEEFKFRPDGVGLSGARPERPERDRSRYVAAQEDAMRTLLLAVELAKFGLSAALAGFEAQSDHFTLHRKARPATGKL
jgi:hypothetical protein